MPEDAPTTGDTENRDVLLRRAAEPTRTWVYGTHPDQVADVYHGPTPARSVVVAIHGGYWRPAYDRTHLRPLCSSLSDHGHLVVSLEYRRIPGNPDATLDDCRQAWAALPALLSESHAAGLPVVLLGHSAGGQLALLLASEKGAPCLALAPIADLLLADALGLDAGAVRDFLGTPASDRPDLDPARASVPDAAAPRVVVLHGSGDTLVPLKLARSFTTRRGTPVRLDVVPGIGHFELIDPLSAIAPQVRAAIDELAANGATPPSTGIE